MSDLSPRTQALLNASRAARDPSPRQLEHARHSLFAKLAAGAVAVGYAATTATASAGAATGLGVGAKLVLVSAVALGGLGGWQWSKSSTSTTPQAPIAASKSAEARSSAPVQAPPAEAAPVASTTPPSTVEPVAMQRVAPGAAAGPVQRAAPADPLLEEARLLGEVQRALGAGQAARALEGLREYDARFPRGGLRVEAEAARTLVSCQGGSSDAGRAAAERFLKRYPSSPAVSRVRQACSESVR